ncbi:MAG TPA: methylenetetrahydrofolate--tRNA-(uracil(54)-C(5))-methyltransferase (FADH(2)-oxidizing) TrmFO [Firmicutes bacterium]|jgi:methylenetetrahydrofolate--tRNA-(uracil-5-)-methyltransferase|nr:methylenetetrahydrofolate--tRNA-(uracil(54)-C(5))-methyltransferase (FADH(2)-oxidizing) TrmFO [Bacillota bacterium]HBK59413.1 methylenetetrahydrofolate--tRNA-(uracil(54)-C(5))-methyltransferase (FADH(2)-oxidizing) TrmFO [Bacillota bacterium]
MAGSEAAWQAAHLGVRVKLVEMRPAVSTPAHSTPDFAELVCSNSLGSDREGTAPGLLKEELRSLGSVVMQCADGARVPAGQALAVDRTLFSAGVTRQVESMSEIEIVREQALGIPDEGIVIVATGPLTSPALAGEIARFLGEEHLHFFDAAAPIIDSDSIDLASAFWASRYDKGDADYLNCPMNQAQYDGFWQALVSADVSELHEFESLRLFEGCMPVEELARRGRDTLRFGPMKPVGLVDPRTGKRPYAAVQLRKENTSGSLLNIVGFQTRLTRSEQRRVFRMIPGLAQAEFLRYGMMHRNTYINGPAHLCPTLSLKRTPRVFMAGQITGVEGYLESTATGLVAGVNAALMAHGAELAVFPRATAMGALCWHVSTPAAGDYQPMNVNFGLLPAPAVSARRNEKRARQISEARAAMSRFMEGRRGHELDR